MKEIQLTQGKIALIDDEDFDMVSAHKWYYNGDGYARSGKHVLLHRLILNAKSDEYVDHKNRNGLDCRRDNIRLCTKSENGMNRGLDKDNTSGFKGVTFNRNCKKFQAQIKANGKYFYLGLFDNAEQAGKAYDEAALRLFGKFARTNYGGDE